jgi:hypothetical protein
LRTVGTIVILIFAGSIYGLIVMRGAPIRISAFPLDGNYEGGIPIGGIVWKDNYSDVRLSIDNDSYWTYANIDIIIKTNVLIAHVGSASPLTSCTSSVDFGGVNIAGAEMHVTKDGLSESVPLFTPEAKDTYGTQYRILCDKIVGGNNLDLIIAVVPGMFKKQREKASWISATVKVDTLGREFEKAIRVCFV